MPKAVDPGDLSGGDFGHADKIRLPISGEYVFRVNEPILRIRSTSREDTNVIFRSDERRATQQEYDQSFHGLASGPTEK